MGERYRAIVFILLIFTDMDVKLRKTNARGKTQVYNVKVIGNTATYEWGQIGGKMQTQVDTYEEGKQGRSAAEQAMFEAKALIKNKLKSDYVEVTSDEDVKVTSVKFVSPLPMLAREADVSKLPQQFTTQPKLDGIRAVCNSSTGELWSRRRTQHIGLPHIEDAVKALGYTNKWLDGELYKHGLGFQTIASIVRKTTNADPEKSRVIQYHIYDICDSSMPFWKRETFLETLRDRIRQLGLGEVLVVVPETPATPDTLSYVHERNLSKRYEGTMIRLPNTKYEPGKRSKGLLKLKDFRQEEYTVTGVKKAAHEDTLGSVECVMRDGQVFYATPSMTDEEKQYIWDHPDEFIGKVCTVKFFETTDDGKPRFPVLLGFRHEDDM